jgi:hypothetical protein
VTAWKRLELRICRALGGERRGPTGQTCSDCSEGVPFAVEIKRSKRGVPEGRWIEQAQVSGRRERKPWLLVVCRHGSPRPIVVCDFLAFAQLAEEAGRIRGADLAPFSESSGYSELATPTRRSTSKPTSARS